MLTRSRCVFAAALLLTAQAATTANAAAAAADGLLAGTGKALIDPLPSQFPIRNNNDSPLVGVHDSLYARALVLQGRGSKALIVVADVIMLPDDFCEALLTHIAADFGIDRNHVLLVATHVHTVPWSMDNGYAEVVTRGVLEAIGQAQARLEPVRVGAGSGAAYVNMNRDEAVPGGFILGQDPEGASDKTVRVVGFFRDDGSPLAILANYAVHAVTLYSSDTAGAHAALVSADIPGVADRFVDEHYAAQRTQAFWTSGAAGDQNPIMMSIHAEPGSDGKVQLTDLQAAGFTLTQRLGQALALEIIRVTDRLAPQEVTAPLHAAQSVIQCATRPDAATTQEPQTRSVRVSRLGIGPVELIGVSGEVTTLIDRHLRERLGQRQSQLVTLTLANGYSGYLPDEAMYARGNTFEVSKSSFAPGCVERSIVDGALRLLGPAAQ
ncbi:MAG: neutral/alkaline non-lysosomal ceramidase N-terminal domain-containing protein [Proteobacteria bacterium]|nr:neutral/alkaline non-lysosomal ceramidase N-terminal domain-containing protein [Pseudomonadota bacterium]